MFSTLYFRTTGTTLPALQGPLRPVERGTPAGTTESVAPSAKPQESSALPTVPPAAENTSVAMNSARPSAIGTVTLWSRVPVPGASALGTAVSDTTGSVVLPVPKPDGAASMAPLSANHLAGGNIWTGATLVSSANTAALNNASSEPRVQSILGFVEEALVLSDAAPTWRSILTASTMTRPGPLSWSSIALSAFGVKLPSASLAMRRPTALSWAARSRGQASVPPPASPGFKAFFTSLGVTSGEAFRMVVVNEGGSSVQLSAEGFVLEPLALLSQKEVDRELERFKTQKRTTATVLGYCLEFEKLGPPAGMVFRIASLPVQQKFAATRPVLRASRTLLDSGKLIGGNGEPYLHQVRQWAIWTHQQKFDESGFTRAFLDHSRKNLESAGRRLTRELEAQLRQLLPARWQDVRQVLDLAAQP
jgi:hypothetical protein